MASRPFVFRPAVALLLATALLSTSTAVAAPPGRGADPRPQSPTESSPPPSGGVTRIDAPAPESTAPALEREVPPQADGTASGAVPPSQPGPAGADTTWDSYDPAPASGSPPPPAASAGPPPPTAEPLPPPRRPRARRRARRRGLGLMISGYAAFFGIWLVTAVAGAATFDAANNDFLDDEDADRQRAVGRRLMIPVAGPYAAAFVTDTATGALFSVLSGVAQTATLAMGIAGTVVFARHRNAQRRLDVGMSPTWGGSMLRLRYRF